MKAKDLSEVVSIEKLSFNAPKPESVFKEDEHKYLVAKDEGKVLGYIGIEEISGERHIINMAVHPESRRKGVGKKLIERILNKKDVFFLEVRVLNEPAVKLYEKYGFKNVGLRKKYYQDNGEDAIIMRREPGE
ncbi:MAG: ribosomal protein S18-alanine N-acetyltransferase [Candidatus Margulisiibacteriota bacterium]